MARGKKKEEINLIEAVKVIVKEKGLPEDLIFESIETALDLAYKKNYQTNENAKLTIDRNTGAITVFAEKIVVEIVADEILEIALEDALLIKSDIALGDMCTVEVTPEDFGRIAQQTGKNVILQKLNLAEREILIEKYKEMESEIYNAVVQRRDGRNIIVTINDIEAKLPISEQIPGERFERNQSIQVYVKEVKDNKKGHAITVSRSSTELVRRLFEQNVSEIFDGIVEIKSISREAGSRTKLAVYSNDEMIDPVGACVGVNGTRVNSIVDYLNGEKVDIVYWYEDARYFIAESLSPSDVLAVELNEEDNSAKVVVPDDQLSLAIGKMGQNARLAVRLTGWKIDIKGESASDEIGFVKEESYNFKNNETLEHGEYYEDEYYDEEEYLEDDYSEEVEEDETEDIEDVEDEILED
ncbi:MAG: transcription termination factor NusA [Lachnospirales bacterium]